MTVTPSGLFTRDQVAAAVNAAADELAPEPGYEDSSSIEVQDRSNLFVNLALGWLDNPAATADQIVADAYSEDAGTVRGWCGI